MHRHLGNDNQLRFCVFQSFEGMMVTICFHFYETEVVSTRYLNKVISNYETRVGHAQFLELVQNRWTDCKQVCNEFNRSLGHGKQHSFKSKSKVFSLTLPILNQNRFSSLCRCFFIRCLNEKNLGRRQRRLPPHPEKGEGLSSFSKNNSE